MSFSAKAELGALFINAKQAAVIWATLTKMGHLQLPMPIQTDQSTVMGIITNTILLKVTKAMDMCFYWLQDREQQQQFCYLWRPGTTHPVDNQTKHHSTAHHRAMKP